MTKKRDCKYKAKKLGLSTVLKQKTYNKNTVLGHIV